MKIFCLYVPEYIYKRHFRNQKGTSSVLEVGRESHGASSIRRSILQKARLLGTIVAEGVAPHSQLACNFAALYRHGYL
jgi:hypothetical protein